jgi:hypothetical protein
MINPIGDIIAESIYQDIAHAELVDIEDKIVDATVAHNEFLAELGLPLLPLGDPKPAKNGKKGK